MPNHIQNRLVFCGSDSVIAELLEAIKGEPSAEGTSCPLDFNKIIPMPSGMDISSGSWTMPIENQFSQNTTVLQHVNRLRDFIQSNPAQGDEALESFFQGVRNYVNHGHATWYSWSIENWGTKWNAYDLNDKRDTENTLHFQTAWAAPLPVIKALSAKFPAVTIALAYADEDSGSNTGKILFEGGEAIEEYFPKNQSKEAYDLYLELHPDRAQDYELVDGNYEYKEDE